MRGSHVWLLLGGGLALTWISAWQFWPRSGEALALTPVFGLGEGGQSVERGGPDLALPKPFGSERSEDRGMERPQVASSEEAPFGVSEARMEEIYAFVESQLQVTEAWERNFQSVFGPHIAGMGREAAQATLGRRITIAQYEQMLVVEAPLNEEAKVLGELYSQEFDYVLRSIWAEKRFAVVSAMPDGSFRKASPNESLMTFDGEVGVYYSVTPEMYPQLMEMMEQLYDLNQRRVDACLDSLSK